MARNLIRLSGFVPDEEIAIDVHRAAAGREAVRGAGRRGRDCRAVAGIGYSAGSQLAAHPGVVRRCSQSGDRARDAWRIAGDEAGVIDAGCATWSRPTRPGVGARVTAQAARPRPRIDLSRPRGDGRAPLAARRSRCAWRPRASSTFAGIEAPAEGVRVDRVAGGAEGRHQQQPRRASRPPASCSRRPGLSIPSIPSFTPNRDLLVGVLKSRTLAQAIVGSIRPARAIPAPATSTTRSSALHAPRRPSPCRGKASSRSRSRIETPRWPPRSPNHYVELLDQFIAQYGTGEAGKQRVFLTGQLARSRVDLDAAEQALRRFQEQNRAIVLQEQTKGAIEAAARLKGEIIAAEVQLQVMRNFATEANPEVVAIRRRIGEMNRFSSGRCSTAARGAAARRAETEATSTVPFAQCPGGRARARPADPRREDPGDAGHPADPAARAGEDRGGARHARSSRCSTGPRPRSASLAPSRRF